MRVFLLGCWRRVEIENKTKVIVWMKGVAWFMSTLLRPRRATSASSVEDVRGKPSLCWLVDGNIVDLGHSEIVV